MKAHGIPARVIESLIRACAFMFVSYLFINIKTYKIKLTSA
jgi:hypothetical protein